MKGEEILLKWKERKRGGKNEKESDRKGKNTIHTSLKTQKRNNMSAKRNAAYDFGCICNLYTNAI